MFRLKMDAFASVLKLVTLKLKHKLSIKDRTEAFSGLSFDSAESQNCRLVRMYTTFKEQKSSHRRMF